MRLPCGNDAVDIGLAMREYNHQKAAGCAHAQGDEALLAHGIRVFAGQREVIIQDGRGLGKADFVGSQIGGRLGGIPFNVPRSIVWTIVLPVNPALD